MVEAVACDIEFTGEGGVLDYAVASARFVVYDVSTNGDGAVTSLKRRVIAGFEHLAKLVNLARFESCIRRWRFEGSGKYTVTLFKTDSYWTIQVRADSRQFRLTVSRQKSTP
jgi:hypothetical protein